MSVRGGAGSGAELQLEPLRFLYGNDGKKVIIDQDVSETFRDALFTLFPTEGYIRNTKSWFFHIDVYQNQHKAGQGKIYQRTIDMDMENFEQRWVGSIRHLIFNQAHDWILRAQPARLLDEPAPKIFSPDKNVISLPPTKYKGWQVVTKKSKPTKNTGHKNNSSKPGPSGYNSSRPVNAWFGTVEGKMNVMKNENSAKFTNTSKADKVTCKVGKKSKQTIKLIPPARAANGYIYGYRGKLLAENTPESFLEAALVLTDQYPVNELKTTWSFDIDVPVKTSQKKLVINLAQANWPNLFLSAVLPYLEANQQWKVFVRRGGKVSDALEPSETARDIVRINVHKRGTAYWKVPSDQDTLANCGINQIQPDFVKAMRLLCYEEDRRKEELHLHSFSLGLDGLECVENRFWELVKYDRNHGASLKYDLTFRPVVTSLPSPADSTHTTIQMAGSNSFSTVPSGNHLELAQEILSMSESYLSDRLLPGSFRVWENGRSRKFNGDSAVIKHKPIEQACNGLKKFFKGSSQSHTIWFRPEWETFYLHDIDAVQNATEWDSHTDQSLQSFKRALGKLWSETGSYNSFCITEMPSLPGRGIRFIINKDTTEDDWRLYVYDWLHSNHLAVKKNMNVNYGKKIYHISYFDNLSLQFLTQEVNGVSKTHRSNPNLPYLDICRNPSLRLR